MAAWSSSGRTGNGDRLGGGHPLGGTPRLLSRRRLVVGDCPAEVVEPSNRRRTIVFDPAAGPSGSYGRGRSARRRSSTGSRPSAHGGGLADHRRLLLIDRQGGVPVGLACGFTLRRPNGAGPPGHPPARAVACQSRHRPLVDLLPFLLGDADQGVSPLRAVGVLVSMRYFRRPGRRPVRLSPAWSWRMSPSTGSRENRSRLGHDHGVEVAGAAAAHHPVSWAGWPWRRKRPRRRTRRPRPALGRDLARQRSSWVSRLVPSRAWSSVDTRT